MNRHSNILSTLVLTALLSLSACHDDIGYDSQFTSEKITFSVAESSTFQEVSRNGRPKLSRSAQPTIKLGKDNEGNEFFLHTHIIDGIESDTTSTSDEVTSRATGTINMGKDDQGKNIESLPNSSTWLNSSVGMTCYHYDGEWSDDLPMNFTANANIVPQADGSMIYKFRDGDRFWPQDGKMTFMAMSPSGSSNGKVFFGDNRNGPVQITYETPWGSWDQMDILYGVVKDVDCSKKTKDLKFTLHHACTEIKFRCSSNMIKATITKIIIRGVHKKGTFTISPELQPKEKETDPDVYGQWVLTDDTDGEYQRGGDWAEPYADITKKYSQRFMMLPQELPTGATIEVYFKDGSNNETPLIADIGGREWPIGKTVEYVLSNSYVDAEAKIEVGDPTPISYMGGSATYDINCVIEKYDGNKHETVPCDWVADFFRENPDGSLTSIDQPDWLHDMKLSGTGEYSQTYSITMPNEKDKERAFEDIEPHRLNIQKNGWKSGIDLSDPNKTGKPVNTANCYIVNAAGTYKFPLVYGNAITKGDENPAAYTFDKSIANGSTPAHVLENFVNYTGSKITSPYIYKDKDADGNLLKPAGATLIWADSGNLLQRNNVILTNNNTYLQFETKGVNEIREGNAIVAVTDAAGNIMWSWHIWITDYVPDQIVPTDLENEIIDFSIVPTDRKVISEFTYEDWIPEGATAAATGSKEYTFMGINLGWCSDRIRNYFERKVVVRYRAVVDGTPVRYGDKYVEEIRTIIQTPGSISIDGNSTYYQFGRKDPIPPASGSKYADPSKWWFYQKALTVKDEKYRFKADQILTAQPIEESIKFPYYFISDNGSSNDWCSTAYYNLWSANIYEHKQVHAEDYKDVKTVYDPCPAGYKVPDLFAFSFTTRRGLTSGKNNWSKTLNAYKPDDVDNYVDYMYEKLGLIFYCNPKPSDDVGDYDKKAGMIFFPAIGIRSYNKAQFSYNNNRGYCWASIPQFQNVPGTGIRPDLLGCCFGFRSGLKEDNNGILITDANNPAEVMTKTQNSRSGALPIRPVKIEDWDNL